VIDLLVPDHLPSRIRARVMRRPVMAAAGGAQALERAIAVTLADTAERVSVAIPDMLGVPAASLGADVTAVVSTRLRRNWRECVCDTSACPVTPSSLAARRPRQPT
jgi:hypothetical protein